MASIYKIFILILLIVGVIQAQKNTFSKIKEDKSCRNVVAQLNKLQFGQINKCASQLGFTTTKERMKKSSCLLKCVLQSVGVMDLDGSVSPAKLDLYIDDHFPENLREKAHTTFTPCLELVEPPNPSSNSTQVAGSADENCKSHEKFITCMARNFLTLCQK